MESDPLVGPDTWNSMMRSFWDATAKLAEGMLTGARPVTWAKARSKKTKLRIKEVKKPAHLQCFINPHLSFWITTSPLKIPPIGGPLRRTLLGDQGQYFSRFLEFH